MATSNGNVLSGFDTYAVADIADGRLPVELSRSTVLAWPAEPLKVRLDVIPADGDALVARAVPMGWPGPL